MLYTRQGCTRLTYGDRISLLPPARAAWIPGGLRHRAQMRLAVDYRSLYFEATLSPSCHSSQRSSAWVRCCRHC
ncbi:hypothetical protein [Stenotrophomonas sp. NRRL B-14846]|uniref:hypothetical protein n=1 Tax=Stenotrophomonas sp. NRRL B-14846 TaxID=3162882 RepID=UPI003D27A45F